MPDEKKPIRVFANGEVRNWFGTLEELAARYDNAVVLEDEPAKVEPKPAGASTPQAPRPR